ncbi:MAG TPA: ankyrin repeat domain-containing protein [Polyangiaceae bacterium]|jgi:ankyrin repeat protein
MTADELSDRIVQGDVRAVSTALRADPSLALATTADGDTALHIACWQKQLAIVAILAAYAPDLNARGCYSRTPLHYAVHEGRFASVPIVALLLALGADPWLREDNGFSVEDWAKTEMDDGLAEVLDLLRRRGTSQAT